MSYPQFHRAVIINAPASQVWAALTQPELMQQWMSESEIDIITDWTPGSTIVVKGDLHGIVFENDGKVLQFEPERTLAYSHRSSISDLPEEEASYVVFEFRLKQVEEGTELDITIDNFPTEAIYRHLVFYWNVVPELLKKFVQGLPRP